MNANSNRSPRVEVRVTHRFRASAQRVFDSWLDPAMASAWLFATASRPMARVEIDARVGGSFCFVDRRDGEDLKHVGEYLEIVPSRRLVFTLSRNGRSRGTGSVHVEIVPTAGGCKLTLTHENVPQDYANRTEGRWAGMLYGLGTMLGRNSGRADRAPVRQERVGPGPDRLLMQKRAHES